MMSPSSPSGSAVKILIESSIVIVLRVGFLRGSVYIASNTTTELAGHLRISVDTLTTALPGPPATP
jgi:hypothetical protein